MTERLSVVALEHGSIPRLLQVLPRMLFFSILKNARTRSSQRHHEGASDRRNGQLHTRLRHPDFVPPQHMRGDVRLFLSPRAHERGLQLMLRNHRPQLAPRDRPDETRIRFFFSFFLSHENMLLGTTSHACCPSFGSESDLTVDRHHGSVLCQ